jgi:Ca2+-binding EF-hand superfamily protein
MQKNNRTQRDPAKLFQRRDQNQDGFVTLEEFIGDPTNRNVPALTKMFQSKDTNEDQRLTLEEIKSEKKQ